MIRLARDRLCTRPRHRTDSTELEFLFLVAEIDSNYRVMCNYPILVQVIYSRKEIVELEFPSILSIFLRVSLRRESSWVKVSLEFGALSKYDFVGGKSEVVESIPSRFFRSRSRISRSVPGSFARLCRRGNNTRAEFRTEGTMDKINGKWREHGTRILA